MNVFPARPRRNIRYLENIDISVIEAYVSISVGMHPDLMSWYSPRRALIQFRKTRDLTGLICYWVGSTLVSLWGVSKPCS